MPTVDDRAPEQAPAHSWWLEPAPRELWNGVFQGGGAKGVAYVGALRAVADARCWFQAVAGSSAGAITACMIAAGLTVDEMEAISADGLASVRKVSPWRHVRGFLGGEHPLYDTEALRDWVENVLRDQVEAFTGSRSTSDVTFEDLFLATGIDLFIVLLDADAGVPIVLSHHNAARTQVASAVVASSAIPLALPKQHLVVTDPVGGWQVRRIFDGGGWANYPRFVFADSSFRAFSGLPDVDPAVRTVGFVLQVGSQRDAASSERPASFVKHFERDRSKRPTAPPEKNRLRKASAAFGLGLLAGALMNLLFAEEPQYSTKLGLWLAALAAALMWIGKGRLGVVLREFLTVFVGARLTRLLLLGSVLLSFVLSMSGMDKVSDLVVYSPPQGDGGLREMFSSTFGFLLLFMLPMAVILVFLLLLAVIRFQRFLFFDATAVLGAVMGAATRVPLWAGHGPGDHLVAVPVDPPLGTRDFDIDEDVRREVIRNARAAATARVAVLLASPVSARIPPHERPHPAANPAIPPGHADLNPSSQFSARENIAFSCIMFFGLIVLMGGFFSYAVYTNHRAGAASDAALVTVTAVTVMAAVLLAGSLAFARRARRQREAAAQRPIGDSAPE